MSICRRNSTRPSTHTHTRSAFAFTHIYYSREFAFRERWARVLNVDKTARTTRALVAAAALWLANRTPAARRQEAKYKKIRGPAGSLTSFYLQCTTASIQSSEQHKAECWAGILLENAVPGTDSQDCWDTSCPWESEIFQKFGMVIGTRFDIPGNNIFFIKRGWCRHDFGNV